MIAALLLMSLAGVMVVAVAGSIRTVLRDGYRRRPAGRPRPEFPDPASRDLVSSSARSAPRYI
ncbi:hypothetical protein AB3M83_00775 [Microbacterium sp. 179-B 1A2 NHS]|uniref:hypothetical protein n=1 Tax=Microbacterium sp. 179-B 1A2 NHS TaxID=3142383 RepID=UPI0039A17CB1